MLRLNDIATIELGAQTYAYNGEIDGHPGATAMISQTAGSNANEIIQEIDQLMEEVRRDLPKGLELVDVIKSGMPARALKEKQHPAKRSFQAVRIAVNGKCPVYFTGRTGGVIPTPKEILKFVKEVG